MCQNLLKQAITALSYNSTSFTQFSNIKWKKCMEIDRHGDKHF